GGKKVFCGLSAVKKWRNEYDQKNTYIDEPFGVA
ncbi:MAG: hypothetical protein PWR01_4045, partial [Clostridiales bacterium]|nr:hypothetical protein [Clostridiales bacterium]MDN5282972.1 hypothetical protein [Candidatus Ozemobacter sp.]